uniref:Uncharacterized protein n=1 Tax=Siphoviridae sp. ct3r22 TaxID=2825325 RepID=A0A8S5V114_9CAUD|nr:MAG TPA: hypothetical protein [Siphoviridae sp. ct3r22]
MRQNFFDKSCSTWSKGGPLGIRKRNNCSTN